jgi:hypothetical protein
MEKDLSHIIVDPMPEELWIQPMDLGDGETDDKVQS